MNAENVVEMPGTNATANQGRGHGKAGTRTIVESAVYEPKDPCRGDGVLHVLTIS